MLCMWLLGACSYPPHHRYKKRHRPALIAAFDEFHRAQCLFTAAIQIASIIVLKDNHLNYSGSTLRLNYVFLPTVALNQIISITYTYWFLTRATRPSIYRFSLTFATFALACAGFATVTWYSENIEASRADIRLSSCGRIDLGAQCAFQRTNLTIFVELSQLLSLALIPCGLLMLHLTGEFLIPDYITETLTALRYCMPSRKGDVKPQWRAYRCVKDHRPQFRGPKRFCVLIFRTVYFMLFFLQAFILGQYFDKGVDTSNWSFGQIVAVAVWASPVLEFVQFEFGKSTISSSEWSQTDMLSPADMKNSFVHRLPTGYCITHEHDDMSAHPSDEEGIPHHDELNTAQNHEIIAVSFETQHHQDINADSPV